ncbi:DedA family protein [Pelomonas sp. V22]|uniref:DedA family protein n=1 Tax=Pelomonas sp. V22 TaxID=2822139 RepID=UPI0024A9BA7E|nr:DedA family protein [Pelomonas sp. V22]MDI4631466.1 DedA family protein [Pelomonas sp. V22]
MEFITLLIDFVVHVDKHLATFVAAHGAWIYGLLFLIIFVETGVVVMPFLPGDSLLFIVGAMCGTGLLDLGLSISLMSVAAVAGNQSNYAIGRYFGPKVFQWENSRFFNRKAFDQAHAFYERHGGITIVIARFMPFVRTFAPFVAGVAQMTRSKFTLYDVSGGLLWVVGITMVGYLFGNVPWVQANLEKIIWAMIIIPGLIAIGGGLRSKLRRPNKETA